MILLYIGDIHQRQKAWDSKKNMKIEILKTKNVEKELEECIFRPKLVILIFKFYKFINIFFQLYTFKESTRSN